MNRDAAKVHVEHETVACEQPQDAEAGAGRETLDGQSGKVQIQTACLMCLERLMPDQRWWDVEHEGTELALEYGMTDGEVQLFLPVSQCGHLPRKNWKGRRPTKHPTGRLIGDAAPDARWLLDADDPTLIYLRADIPWKLSDEADRCDPDAIINAVEQAVHRAGIYTEIEGDRDYVYTPVHPRRVLAGLRRRAERRLVGVKDYYGLPAEVHIQWVTCFNFKREAEALRRHEAKTKLEYDRDGGYPDHIGSTLLRDGEAGYFGIAGWVAPMEPLTIYLRTDVAHFHYASKPHDIGQTVVHEATHVWQQLHDGVFGVNHDTAESEAYAAGTNFPRLRRNQLARRRRAAKRGVRVVPPALPYAQAEVERQRKLHKAHRQYLEELAEKRAS